MVRHPNPLVKIALFSLFLLIMLGSFVVAYRAVTRGHNPRLVLTNVTTQGRVLYVGPSTVGAGPAVVGYGYNSPEFPRKPWSFQREQVVAPTELAKFRVGTSVPVEYARTSPGTSPGTSRLQGYGKTRSVLLDDRSLWLPPLLAIFSVPLFYIWQKLRGH